MSSTLTSTKHSFVVVMPNGHINQLQVYNFTKGSEDWLCCFCFLHCTIAVCSCFVTEVFDFHLISLKKVPISVPMCIILM